MKLDLQPIAGVEGASMPFDFSMDLHEVELSGEYPFAEPVRVNGKVTMGPSGFELSGSAETTLHVHCARCGKEVERSFSVPLSGLLLNGADPDDLDAFPLEGTTADLSLIAQSILLVEMDMVFLCSPDCKGLCPRCGADLNEGACSCHGKQADPRLAPLADLLARMKEEEKKDK